MRPKEPQPIKIRHLVFHDDNSEEFLTPSQIEVGEPLTLPRLSKINIFVGANNSGKSRLLRSLLKNKHNYIPDFEVTEDFKKIIERVLNKTQNPQLFKATIPLAKHNEDTIQFENFWLKRIVESWSGNMPNQIVLANIVLEELVGYCTGGATPLYDERQRINFVSKLNEVHKSLCQQSNRIEFKGDPQYAPDIKFTYIPLMRGLRPLIKHKNLTEALNLKREQGSVTVPLSEKISSLFGVVPKTQIADFLDVYKSSTHEDYPETKKADVYTGLRIYDDIRDLLLGSVEQRRKVREFESFLSETFFEGQSVELTPNAKFEGVLHVKIGDENEKPIHQLGDGIQAMIAILYPLKIKLDHSKHNFVIIEEPELNLHPGLQRQLVEALMEIPNAQFFLTTHSNHFLESLYDKEDISLYKVSRRRTSNDQGELLHRTQVTPVLSGDKSILSDLGVINSSVFLSNCTIWVEGVTDRQVFRHYLSLYQKHLRDEGEEAHTYLEDKHYSFVEYGGANITHWSWLDKETNPINVERLCGTFMLIADDDNAEEGEKSDRLNKLNEKLQDRFVRLECKETENLLAVPVIQNILKEFTETEFDISSRGWVAFSKQPVGKYLDEVVATKKLQLRGNKKKFTSGNTVSNKSQFCQLGIKHTKSWSDLSDEGQRVTKAIYDFIVSQN